MTTDRLQDMKPQALIVDDDPELLGALARRFRLDGYDVRTAHNGRVALELLIAEHDFQPVVILSDHDMPLMTGSELCRQLRMTFPKLEPRFILMSGNDRVEKTAQALCVPFLSKPFGDAALHAAIKVVLP